MKKMKKVRPEDFDVKLEELKAAARRGKLYLDMAEEISLEEVVNNVRTYIEAIKPFVTPQFRTSVDALWEDIFQCEELRSLLMPSSKARNCRDFNKVGVKGIICVLINNGVYKEFSGLKYERALEKTNADSSSRRYLTSGIKNNKQRLKVREIVNKYKF